MGKLAEVLSHPDEIWPLLQLYQQARRAKQLPSDETWRWCYGALNKTSRSFALVIQQLPPELKDAVCVFYLVLRALDTVEDDMAIPVETKLPILRSFHEKVADRSFSMEVGGKPTDKELMENYPMVADAFLKLSSPMQKVIKDITQRMGEGMAEFIEKEVETVADWDQYCHYVAGLVGIGLSQLFAASEREGSDLADMEDLANHMGLFLQKTNIIRDYLEDILEEPAPRMFWPKEIWGKYADELAAFKEPKNLDNGLQCLNEMITNALGHVEHCFDFMIRLRDPAVFRFCAIPQVMAMGTLALCYNNPDVFKGVVKMRRGQTATLVVGMEGMESLYSNYIELATAISLKCQGVSAPKNEQITSQTLKQVEAIETLCSKGLARYTKSKDARDLAMDQPIEWPVRIGILLLFGGYFAYAWQLGALREEMGVVAPGDVRLDYLQKTMSIFLMIFALFVFFTGKRI